MNELCCHGDCAQGRACPLRTRNGGASVDTTKPTGWLARLRAWAAHLFH